MSDDSKALAIIPRSMPEVQSMAEVLAKSTLLPDGLKGNAPDVVVQILAGQELGLSPMASIRGVHIVQGKPLLSADTMVALCRSSGLCEYFSCVEETETKVTYETKRKGDPAPQRVTWSDEDTKLAALNTKENWRAHKKQMRRARAKAILARDVYPDVLAGCYDPDEIQVPATRPAAESAPANTNADAIDAEIVEVRAFDLSLIDSAESPDALKAFVPELNKLKGDERKAARARYDARMKSFDKPEVAA